jgi:hypothetical protein
LHGWILLLIRQLQGAPVDWAGATLRVILPGVGLNLVLTIVVGRFLRRFSRTPRLVAG